MNIGTIPVHRNRDEHHPRHWQVVQTAGRPNPGQRVGVHYTGALTINPAQKMYHVSALFAESTSSERRFSSAASSVATRSASSSALMFQPPCNPFLSSVLNRL